MLPTNPLAGTDDTGGDPVEDEMTSDETSDFQETANDIRGQVLGYDDDVGAHSDESDSFQTGDQNGGSSDGGTTVVDPDTGTDGDEVVVTATSDNDSNTESTHVTTTDGSTTSVTRTEGSSPSPSTPDTNAVVTETDADGNSEVVSAPADGSTPGTTDTPDNDPVTQSSSLVDGLSGALPGGLTGKVAAVAALAVGLVVLGGGE